MQDNFFVKNKSIITFLILEVAALTAFNFGNISYIFGIAGIILAIFGCLFVLNIEKDYKSLWKILIPVGLLIVIAVFGSILALYKFDELTKEGKEQAIFSVLSYIALPAFFLMGFFLRKLNDIKPKTVIFILGAALGAATFFGLVSTIIQYGFFYSARFVKTPFYYYDGIPYDVTKEMYWLVGFKFTEVFIEYGSMFAILSASFLPGLLFISPKEERNDFIICSSIGGVGLLTLLILPNFKAILVLAVASAIAFVYKYLKNHKNIQKFLGIFALSVVGLGVIFYLLTIINAGTGFKFSGFLERIFVNNGLMKNSSDVLKVVFEKDGSKLPNFFGLLPLSTNQKAFWNETKIFEIQIIKEIGVLPSFIFLGFLGFVGWFIYRYFKKGTDSDFIKVILVVLILSFFVFETFFNVISFTVHNSDYVPFLRSSMFMTILFIMGFVFMTPKKEEEKHE